LQISSINAIIYQHLYWKEKNCMELAFDEIDARILNRLQADAGQANQDLAAAVGISPATALRRVRRLEDAGVLAQRIGLLSSAVLSRGLQALVEVQLDRQGAEHLAAFEAQAVADTAVQQCWRLSPGPDFLLVLWVRDMAAYNAVVQRLFTQQANVRNVKTFFATACAKFEPRVDAQVLLQASA
jgi:Lrp/AsnC family transcriptional regulator, leucine-responsive regulatory protein